MKNFFYNVLRWLKRFFIPPANTPLWMKVLPYAILGVLTVMVLAGGTYAWNYTNSSEFCGTACHTMPPEYSAYLVSPHARVQCVECHIGRDVITTQFTRKAGDLRHVVLNITKQYEYPIRAHRMQPARESCETCHFPEKFSSDSLHEFLHYNPDETNSQISVFLILKTGGGTSREGLGYGIHWHIENEVWFMATDDLDQEIPFVRVIDQQGEVTEYYDVSTGITPSDVAGSNLKKVDCITCHNRITHNVPDPEGAVGQAMEKDLIPSDLPFVFAESVALLDGEYPDKETAILAMSGLSDFYQDNYPDVYEERQEEIAQAVIVLQDIYNRSVFPEQKFDWDTHFNNLGHLEDPGCFRCHDGKHFTYDGEAIRLECNLCHSIPVTSPADAFVTNIEIVSGPEPPSHTHTSWIALHSDAVNETCQSCHLMPEGVDSPDDLDSKPTADGSFCGNEACHGTVWTYTGFQDPALEPVLEEQLFHLLNTSPYLTAEGGYTYENTFQAVFEGRCTDCHGGSRPSGGLDLSSYEGTVAGGNSGTGVVPGDPAASKVYSRQSRGTGHYSQMLDDEVEALMQWIESGAPEN